ncbi:frizzled-5-like [Physella acuta]|uniref:frizzled-5-like n=1 Tax=Physella acuta TaxID=109671 RepID=UPI0027DCA47E|nr:frizzled-5-like [Physella acuta]XP_059144461.1 frizzled-5-like [Physella acuta]XP_059144462.1 frizzled-5-like [Physella acuta]
MTDNLHVKEIKMSTHFLSGLNSFLFLTSIFIVSLQLAQTAGSDNRKCQEITIPMCKGIGYNMTYMPNQFNHDTQEESGLEVHQFWPLVEIQCSPDLKFFLCSMYAPICMENYKKHLPACRSVCERARDGCSPLMKQYGFNWPDRMKCEDLPEYGDKEVLCMDANTTDRNTAMPAHNKPTPPTNKPSDRDKRPPPYPPKPSNGPRPLPVDELHSTSPAKECTRVCEKPLMMISESSSSYFNKLRTGGVVNCAINCYGPYFSEHEKTFTTFWVGLWSILCCISTSMTVSTFFVDMKRFKYPERPIIFLSACYFMVSVGYIIRLIVGHENVACENGIIRYETTGPAVCTVVFLLVYFFGMASSIWWVILSFTWFLAAGLKWGQEAIASYSQYFHLAAWLIPSVKSIAVLAMSSVDGDPIAGICYVGNQSLDNLRGFVLAPLFVYLIIGASFLLAGFVSLFRIRKVIKQQGRGKTDKLERLMIRIGVFTVLYTVPASIVIACYFYEQQMRERWEATRTHTCYDQPAEPNYTVFMLKYFMCLVIGTTSGFWIWSGKTVDSWRKLFYGKLCNKSNYHNRKYTNTNYQPAKPHPLSHV